MPALAQLQILEHLIELARERIEARHVVAGLGYARYLVRPGHEVRQSRLHAVELLNWKGVQPVRIALDLDAKEVVERVVRQPPLAIERIAVVPVQHVEPRLDQLGVPAVLLGRRIVELVSVEVQPRRENAHLGQHLRTVERESHERRCIEGVDRDRLEVPDVHEQRGRQHDGGHGDGRADLCESLHGSPRRM